MSPSSSSPAAYSLSPSSAPCSALSSEGPRRSPSRPCWLRLSLQASFPALLLGLLLVPFALPSSVHAQDLDADMVSAMDFAEEAPSKGWKGSAMLSYLGNTGNTESESLQASIAPIYGTETWEHRFKFGAEVNTEDRETTAERYEAFYEARWPLSEKVYLFGLIGFERDLFSAFERQWREVVGIGRQVVKTERHELDLSLAGGARQSEIADAPAGQEDENEFIVRGFGSWKVTLSPTSTFQQTLVAEYGDLSTSIDSITALNASLTETIGLQLSYTVRHETDVPAMIDDTDTATAVALTYSF
ncbi:MAG: DUF481 domain-containing protein [Acidobacteriota bacterium]